MLNSLWIKLCIALGRKNKIIDEIREDVDDSEIQIMDLKSDKM